MRKTALTVLVCMVLYSSCAGLWTGSEPVFISAADAPEPALPSSPPPDAYVPPATSAVQGPGIVYRSGQPRTGVMFRMFWFTAATPGQSGQVLSFRFPVYAPSHNQSVRYVQTLHPGARFDQAEHGEVFMSYPEAVAVPGQGALLLGFAAVGSFDARGMVEPAPTEASWNKKVPSELADLYFNTSPLALSLDDPLIVAAAEELREGNPAPLELVRRVWLFVNESIRYANMVRPNTAADVLRAGTGRCGEFTRLTVALLRACGLAARGVYGFRMTADGPTGDGHTWTEAWIPGPGWLPVHSQNKPPSDGRYPIRDYYIMSYYDEFFPDGYIAWSKLPESERSKTYDGPDWLLYDVSYTRSRTPWISGVTFFVPCEPDEADLLTTLVRRIGLDQGSNAAALLAETGALPEALQAFPQYLLCASNDTEVAAKAVQALKAVCAVPDYGLVFSKFYNNAPAFVQARLDAE